MPVKTLIKKGLYFDSVSLMRIAQKLNSLPGISDSAVIMATKENKNIISSSGLLSEEIKKASDNDLAVAVKADSEKSAVQALSEAEKLLSGKKENKEISGSLRACDISQAVSMSQGLNLALISVNGRYAADIAKEALEKGLNTMIFSDNVPLEKEIELKKIGAKKNLLVMGPDCGTAIINGAPLGFANKVNSGSIGVVGPSGTGIQEFTCAVSNLGAGISQAVGTGTRDVKDEVGALTTIEGLKMLSQDPRTRVIAIVSKPPQKKSLEKIISFVKKIKKPVVTVFLGSSQEYSSVKNIHTAKNLYEAALKAYILSKGENPHLVKERMYNEKIALAERIKKEKAKKREYSKYLRGLFSGGTFASQALYLLQPVLGPIYSNIPLSPEFKLKNSMKLEKNSIIDLGEDEFTFGRPHPMIDYSLRKKMIAAQALNKDVSVILLDIVLGYGSNMNPLAELSDTLKEAFKANPSLSIIAAVTGTDMDPQNKKELMKALEDTGVMALENNYAAAFAAGEILRKK